jgi:hypothetical protein
MKFSEWFEQRIMSESNWSRSADPNWKPDARIGGDPLRSGLEKIARGEKEGKDPFSSNTTSHSILAQRLGIDEDEFEVLEKIGLFSMKSSGVSINQPKFVRLYKHIVGMMPDMNQPENLAMKMLKNAPPPPPRKF